MTRRKVDLYNYEKRLGAAFRNLENTSSISARNKEVLKEFCETLIGESISPGRVSKYLYSFKSMLSKWYDDDLTDATEHDLKILVGHIEQAKEYTAHTKRDLKLCLKRFYKWSNKGELPVKAKFISASMKRCDKLLPEDILTEDDIAKLLNAARTTRDRAMIAVHYEGGLRVGELVSLRWKDIQFDNYGAKARVFGKTGERSVRLHMAVPFLKDWRNEHPFKDDEEAAIWVSLSDRSPAEPLCYHSIRKIYSSTAKLAKIKKRANTHAFRHARATFLAGKLQAHELYEYFGWVDGSKSASAYMHLSGKHLDDALLRNVYGLVPKEDSNETKLKLLLCVNCGEANIPSTHMFCPKCKYPLTMDVQKKVNDAMSVISEAMSKVMTSPEAFAKLQEILAAQKDIKP